LHRITILAVLTEGTLAVAAVAASRVTGHTIEIGSWPAGILAGAAACIVLAGVNYWALEHAPAIPPIRVLREVVDSILIPTFNAIRVYEAAIIAIAAGVGEELLFRGVIQREWGIVAASLLFGAAHTGGRALVLFGCWAALMGFVLGAVAAMTGGIVAPVVAHTIYDFAAILYVQRIADIDPDSSEPGRIE
jgi:uncharacterized protein